ncbi:MAG: hypothetical protein R2848_03565 [Thermomicrobiales bacterium]
MILALLVVNLLLAAVLYVQRGEIPGLIAEESVELARATLQLLESTG